MAKVFFRLTPGKAIVAPPDKLPGRPPINGRAMNANERKQKQRKRENEERLKNIAILDFETDPFDENDTVIFPFLCVLYSNNFDPIVIWEEDHERFIQKVVASIEALPSKYTIYAHNGGRFDYMFLIRHIRGKVSFKGRGIMACRIGQHELRDSFHILPEKLANWKKDTFDYDKMKKNKRHKYRQEIIDYCINDCKFLLQFVEKFVKECGLKISIGQAAMYYLRQEYKVENLGKSADTYLRQWYFGGRVECLQGRGKFDGHYKLYDVNSMYPYVMATRKHPISNTFTFRPGQPNEHTVFIWLECNNYGGAFVSRLESGEISTHKPRGEFRTTIWEYEIARKYGLISQVNIKACIDFPQRSTFERFIVPMYERRKFIKGTLEELTQAGFDDESAEYLEAKKDDYLLKYLLNNSYGKFAQNPERYKEHYITDIGIRPPIEEGAWGDLPYYTGNGYAIWERPAPGDKYYNVATAASITGASRAVLLEAIVNSKGAIYCDTDSLICLGADVNVDTTALGAWKLEKELSEVIINGKKQYATKELKSGKIKVKNKGVSGLTWQDALDMMDGKTLSIKNRAPTMTKRGDQYYITRNIRATAEIR